MRKLFLLFLIASTIYSSAQSKKEDTCFVFSAQELRSKFPFNIAKEVKLVSFGFKLNKKSQSNNYKFTLPLKDGIVQTDKLDQQLILTQPQIDTLADILHNTNLRLLCLEGDYAYGSGMCYFPRNAILFFDSTGKMLNYIEICFQCNTLTTSDKKIIEKRVSNDMMISLQNFFGTQGIKTKYTEVVDDLRNH